MLRILFIYSSWCVLQHLSATGTERAPAQPDAGEAKRRRLSVNFGMNLFRYSYLREVAQVANLNEALLPAGVGRNRGPLMHHSRIQKLNLTSLLIQHLLLYRELPQRR